MNTKGSGKMLPKNGVSPFSSEFNSQSSEKYEKHGEEKYNSIITGVK